MSLRPQRLAGDGCVNRNVGREELNRYRQVDDDVLSAGKVHMDSLVIQVKDTKLYVEEKLGHRDALVRIERELNAIVFPREVSTEDGCDVE